ncbi:MAG: Omp28-related outer membrane protein, partial [Gelidibacter sp.]|nr:Omp28-related outer membrane protein [Gelidibacter sp.]
MKVKHLFQIFLVVIATSLCSCGSSSDSDGGGDNPSGLTSISVVPNTYSAIFGSEFTFIVKTNEGADVTSDAVIYVNDVAIAGSSYTPATAGSFTIKAVYNNLTSPNVTITVDPIIESIEIQANNSVVNIGDTITYYVIGTDNDGNTSTLTSAEVYINGTISATGNKFIPGETGTVEAYATFNGMTTETISVTVQENTALASFTKKAVIEDYTGTWCGWCPRVAYGIELVEDQTSDVVVVAAHITGSPADPFQNTYSVQLANAFNVNSFPTAYINRTAEWTYPEPNNVSQVTSTAGSSTTSGVAINSLVKGNNLSVVVSAGFAQNTTGAKLVVYILEDGLIYDQHNYTDYYGGLDVLTNFRHNNVLRYSFTNILGDAIPANETVANNVYNVKYDFTIPSGLVNVPNNIKIAVMLVD